MKPRWTIIEAAGIQSVKIRSALTCEIQTGVCGLLRPRPCARHAGQHR
jgi:DNA-directed RNA polymerase subunit beta'